MLIAILFCTAGKPLDACVELGEGWILFLGNCVRSFYIWYCGLFFWSFQYYNISLKWSLHRCLHKEKLNCSQASVMMILEYLSVIEWKRHFIHLFAVTSRYFENGAEMVLFTSFLAWRCFRENKNRNENKVSTLLREEKPVLASGVGKRGKILPGGVKHKPIKMMKNPC